MDKGSTVVPTLAVQHFPIFFQTIFLYSLGHSNFGLPGLHCGLQTDSWLFTPGYQKVILAFVIILEV